jgi:dipeptidyl aminopeptidase/acylaminoacyl peptidase
MKTVSIIVDDQHINGKLLQPPEANARRPAVLFVHGWGSSQRRSIGKAKQLVQAGFVCLTFNLRGHARTVEQRETVTRAENLRDVMAAYDLLAAQLDVDAERIAVVGGSYGGYLATLLTTERDVRALALRAPALYKDGDFDRPKRQLNLDPDLPAYRRRRLEPSDNIALAAAARFEGDVLIVESEHDTVIPHPVIANYLRAFGAAGSVEHEVIGDADHGLSQKGWRRAWGEVLVRWVMAHRPAPARAVRSARSA